MIESDTINVLRLANPSRPAGIWHTLIQLCTSDNLEFIDLTGRVAESIKNSGIRDGVINIQSTHTTAAIIVNEAEPLLLEDMKRILDRLAPREEDYRHDALHIRTVNLTPGERPNGHAHCKALFLRTAETVNVADGHLQLGRWQRIFLVELDGPRERSVSVTAIGQAAPGYD